MSNEVRGRFDLKHHSFPLSQTQTRYAMLQLTTGLPILCTIFCPELKNLLRLTTQTSQLPLRFKASLIKGLYFKYSLAF